MMNDEKREPIDFLKVIEGIKKSEMEQLKEAFKQARVIYLEMIEAGFTMEEAMTFIAALTKQTNNKEKV
jgi:hypothetical protein